MAEPLQPQLRPLEVLQVGSEDLPLYLFRDPEGFGEAVVLPPAGAVLAMLMDGGRTLAGIQAAFRSQRGVQVPLTDLEAIVQELDEARLLAGERFDSYRREQVDAYLANSMRPASHASGGYAEDPKELREEFDAYFTCDGGPGPIDFDAAATDGSLHGLIAPHIDPARGGPAYAWAYKQAVEHSNADLFVIFGTAHNGLEEWFGISRKDFDTPLGVVPTDLAFIDRLAEHLASSVAGRELDLFADELAHRTEHSIEFQAVFLQYVLGGRREFKIVPVLVDSFQDFMLDGETPGSSPEIAAIVAAVRAVATGHPGKVCYVSAADFAHIGRHFGDPWVVDQQRLADQEADDRKLLAMAEQCDAAGFFAHVAKQSDRSRICGLSPTYTMLEIIHPSRGELLTYDQAVEEDGTSCVSFASMAFYGDS